MDDDIYALLTRLIALSPDGDAGTNALVRETCAKALSLPALSTDGEAVDDPTLAAQILIRKGFRLIGQSELQS